jgi:hypothetical protein
VTRRTFIALLLGIAFLLPARGMAQTAPLPAFVAEVARLWAAGDADGIVDLAPADGRIVLDVGDGASGPVQKRQAAAALRDVFGGRTTVNVRAERATVSGGDPVSGFGELRWESRPRGVTATQRETVFVGVVWEGRGWKIRELRILR